jgi:SagB-type dehydrogenase family enzyme
VIVVVSNTEVIKKDIIKSTPIFVRRSYCLDLHWSEKGLVFQNYLTHSSIISYPLLTHMLGELSDFKSLDEIKKQFAKKGSSNWDEVLQTLIDHNILVIRDSDLDKKEKMIEKWKWDHPARYYHFITKDVEYTFDLQNEKKYFIELAKTEPMPNHYKEYTLSKVIKLSSNEETEYLDYNGKLSSLLFKRRTIRNFNRDKNMSFNQFSRILSYTWGKTSSIDKGEIERRIFRTSPSGGCRHPIEVYPIVMRVEDIPRGIYHYSVKNHSLELIEEYDYENEITNLCSGQPWFKDAAAIFVMTAILERSMWRYRNSRTYRIIQMDAAHLAQTFHLVVTSLNLGPLTTAGVKDSLFEDVLKIDGINEVLIYLCAVGIPKC